jgi:glucose/mannose-6-phosphate isomerase
MRALDGPEALRVDSLGLFEVIARSVDMLDRGVAAGRGVELPYPPQEIHDVVICGMGGSAIAADLVIGVYAERLRRPVAAVRDYVLPGWAGEHTLVVALSYSGTTEETLTCVMDALDRGCPALAVTSGGKLGEWYGAEGVPVVGVPPGLQPRAALLHMLAPLLVVLARLEVIPDVEDDLADARASLAAAVAAYAPEVPEEANPAKRLARILEGSLPLVYGSQMTAPVALRWKCQLNENAKAPAFWAALPELDHNEIVGFEAPGPMGGLTQVVMLRDPRQHRQVERRVEYTREVIEPAVGGVATVAGDGATVLGRVLDLVTLGDFTSLYLAALRGIDPGPVESIGRLKERLAGTGYGRIAGPSPAER